MKSLIVFVFLPLVSSLNLYHLAQDEWQIFKITHGKKYKSNVEEQFRMKIYLENRQKIAKHNQRNATFSLELNSFGDQLPHEFSSARNGLRMDLMNKTRRFVSGTFVSPANVKLPESVDWREQGAVTPVKDQGSCGSCYAFSATGALEGQHFRSTGTLISLSEQNIVDCTANSKYGNDGCNGGLMDSSFEYIRNNHGIDTETGYPYEAQESKCRFRKEEVGAEDKGAVDIPKGNEKKLMEALATIGPISVAIDAGHESFQFYKTGVYYEKMCDSKKLDHGVLLVGYGSENGDDYWLIKNSWGTEWGDEGYIKIARNKDNHCGVATLASYPLVALKQF